MSLYYFAYGSCMDEVDFKRTVAEFKTLGSATLKDYRLAFTLYGESRFGGVADVIPAAGEEVQGVLYTFPKKYLENLDHREGVHIGMYERISINVIHQGKEYTAYTYQVVQKEEQELAPSTTYAQLLLNGMNKFATAEYKQKFLYRLRTKFQLDMRK